MPLGIGYGPSTPVTQQAPAAVRPPSMAVFGSSPPPPSPRPLGAAATFGAPGPSIEERARQQVFNNPDVQALAAQFSMTWPTLNSDEATQLAYYTLNANSTMGPLDTAAIIHVGMTDEWLPKPGTAAYQTYMGQSPPSRSQRQVAPAQPSPLDQLLGMSNVGQLLRSLGLGDLVPAAPAPPAGPLSGFGELQDTISDPRLPNTRSDLAGLLSPMKGDLPGQTSPNKRNLLDQLLGGQL